jgi:hypothetical protein
MEYLYLRGPLKIHFLLRVAVRVTSFVAFYHHISPDMASKSALQDNSFAHAHLKTEYLEVPFICYTAILSFVK